MTARRRGVAHEKKHAEKAKSADTGASTSAPKPTRASPLQTEIRSESLPKDMDKAHAEIARREKEIADPTLFPKNHARFSALAAELENLRASIATMEDEWLELEMLREEIEG